MNRREFITLLGGAAVAWPLAARSQQPAKLPTIGFLGAATLSARSQWVDAFVQPLRELGWIEGRTVAIEYRFAEGRNERMADIAAEFVRLKVDVIVTYSTSAVIAAKEATAAIPIVSAIMGDPVGTGLVASLGRPGGNVTGLSNQAIDTAGKRLDLYIVSDPLMLSNRVRINTFSLVARLPTNYNQREYVEAGGLMSYGPNIPDLFRRTAEFVDKILRGAKPGDLPVQQPTKFDLVINLPTARALGLEVSQMLLARADEVIE
jgi:putative ABC transport system substrate-binding protein